MKIQKLFLICSLLFFLIFWGCGRKKSTLTIWHTESDPKTQEIFEQIGEQLKEKYPNLAVAYEYVSWGHLSSKLKIALQTEPETRLPDISHLQPYMAYLMYDNGLLEDISDTIGYIERQYGEKIFPVVRDLQKFGNRHYGIAQHVGVSFILYRKDILAREKLPIPETWEQFFNVCEALKSGGYNHPISIPV